LKPVVHGIWPRARAFYFRAGFANPKIYENLEAEGIK
jgi:hypothetical protein